MVYNQATMPTGAQAYISVDVETSGPIPGDYSLLSIGACTIFAPQHTFYIELQPINANATPEASAVHQLSMEHLQQEGTPPHEAMLRFEAWLKEQVPGEARPLFVAFNAPFDWMFINYYFIHYLKRNPFGHTAIDIKAFYMGMAGAAWPQTSWRFIDAKYKNEHSEDALAHHALQDAIDQADLFRKMLEEIHIPAKGDHKP